MPGGDRAHRRRERHAAPPGTRRGRFERLSATRVFSPAEVSVLEVLSRKFEGKTEKQKNPHPKQSLAWAAWCIARAGGWNGYPSERPPGPITFTRGLRRFHAIAEGFALAANDSNEPH